MELNISFQNELTEDLVRNHRSLAKLLGNDSLLVRAIAAEIRSRQKTKKAA
jgi:hypothetical protein